MDCGLLIAAGGGGDAIAAAIVHRALDTSGIRATIATYSWDRLLIDPLPGPRDPSSFEGLERLGQLNYRVTPDTTPIPPAGSTLPRLAAELDADLYLLDPRGGAQGLASQIAELRDQIGVGNITLVDVGGDILAHGDEPTLRSPLADSLVLAAIADVNDATVLVAGAGIDGELPESLVLDRYEELEAERVHSLTLEDVAPFRAIFDWHPSEATGLLCAAAAGARGTAEIRDQGFPVALGDHTPDVHALAARGVVGANRIADELRATRSLDAVETVLRNAGPGSEIDYERRKAAKNSARDAVSGPAARGVLASADAVAQVLDDAARRGVDFITLRGLAERLGVAGTGLGELHRHLATRQFGEYQPPLLSIHR